MLVIADHCAKEVYKNLTLTLIWEVNPAKIEKKTIHTYFIDLPQGGFSKTIFLFTIINNIKKGGLKMLDFGIMDKALNQNCLGKLSE